MSHEAKVMKEHVFPQLRVFVQRQQGVQLPSYSTPGSSGADVRAHLQSPLSLSAGETVLIPTGISVEIPSGFEIQVRSRSGLTLKHQLYVLNSPGTIDADYRGEVRIILSNQGPNAFVVEPGMRIAQLVLAPVYHIAFAEVPLGSSTRDVGGFGQTGLD